MQGWGKLEAAPGFEPGITVLQTVAFATWLCRPNYLENNYLYRRDQLDFQRKHGLSRPTVAVRHHGRQPSYRASTTFRT